MSSEPKYMCNLENWKLSRWIDERIASPVQSSDTDSGQSRSRRGSMRSSIAR
ncbi:MAG: hypothetical protein OXK19_01545 [Candidatus Dadabacteria bacterium]|nr:hypothetical protein [Candidatus Dadabacteria bacterium]